MRLRMMGTIVLSTAVLATATVAAAPANDDIADAQVVTEGVEARFTTVDATAEPGEDYCDGINTVWFSFTAPADGDYLAYATGSDHDTEVVWSEELTTTSGNCDDDADDSYDAVDRAVSLTADEQEYVQMGVNGDDYTGTGGVGVVAMAAGTDTFADAPALAHRPGAPSAVAGLAIDSATLETGESTVCGYQTLDDASAWMTFTPPSAGTWFIESKSADSTDLAVYTGSTVDGLTLLQCATQDRKGVLVDLDPSTTYRIRIGAQGSSTETVVRAEKAEVAMAAEVLTEGISEEVDLVTLDGQPAIVHDDTAGDLVVTRRTADGWVEELIDTASTRAMDAEVDADGELTVAYYSGSEMRYAEKIDGVWTVTTVDTGITGAPAFPWDPAPIPSLLHPSDGNPAIAYYDGVSDSLRFAERVDDVWSVTTVDDDGDGSSIDTGSDPHLVEPAEGRLGIVYSDRSNAEVRYAVRTAGTWSDSFVFATDLGDTQGVIGAQVIGDEIVFATIDDGGAHHYFGRGDGGTWSVEQIFTDRALAELDWDCGKGAVLVEGGLASIVWHDCNYSGTIAVHTQLPGGGWTTYDILGRIHDPSDARHAGSIAAWDAQAIGVTRLDDGRMAIAFQESDEGDLVYAEDALVAVAGDDVVGTAATDLLLDGTASADAWGDIVSYAWTGAPAGCTLTGSATASPTMRCVAAASGTVTLTVTDTDGFTHADPIGVEVAAAACPATTVSQFGDVAGTSFAAEDIQCLRGLGVTTGTSPTTFSPSAAVTREQLASFVARLFETITGEPAPIVDHPFVDIDPDSYAVDDIARIYGLGVTTGTSATTFSPDDEVTREQIAAMLSRLYVAIRGESAPIVDHPFVDVDPTSFGADDVARIYGLGITFGTSPTTFAPDEPVTREQLAAMLIRFYRMD